MLLEIPNKLTTDSLNIKKKSSVPWLRIRRSGDKWKFILSLFRHEFIIPLQAL